MRISQRTAAFLLMAVLAVPAIALGQGGRGTLVGKVTDQQGNALQGVVVTVTSPDISGFRDVQTTDKRGTFTVNFREVNVNYRFRMEKAGFDPLEFQQMWRLEGTEHFEWKMLPATKTAVGGLAPTATTSEPA